MAGAQLETDPRGRPRLRCRDLPEMLPIYHYRRDQHPNWQQPNPPLVVQPPPRLRGFMVDPKGSFIRPIGSVSSSCCPSSEGLGIRVHRTRTHGREKRRMARGESFLRGLVRLLRKLVWEHPHRVEELLVVLHDRESRGEIRQADLAGSGIGVLTMGLWIRTGGVRVRSMIDDWVSDPYAYSDILRGAVDSASGALLIGYKSGHQEDNSVSERAQEFYRWIGATLVERLREYIRTGQRAATVERDARRARCYARLIDFLCRRMSVVTGASQSGTKEPPLLHSKALNGRFVTDMYCVLEGIGTVALPGTTHTLIGLLGYLAPGDPANAFDLISHALIRGGREYGYQFEGVGLDRVVEIVGYFLADHRGLFDDVQRRQRLIECLDMFVDAGWPAATRLLFRLPELL